MAAVIIDNFANGTTEELGYELDLKGRLSSAGYLVTTSLSIFIGIFGFLVNLGVMSLMWRDRKYWTTQTIIVFNIICCDFAVSILGFPIPPIMSSISEKWITYGQGMCKMSGFLMSVLGINSITSLTLLAFERYLVVCRRLRYRLRRRFTKSVVAGIWTYSLVLSVPPLIGWGKYVNEAADICCLVNLGKRSPMGYILFLFTSGYFIPLIVILFSFIQIFLKTRQDNIAMTRITITDGQLAYMILLMIVAFLLSWTPYVVIAMLVELVSPSIISPASALIPVMLAKSNICYNPIIYVGVNYQLQLNPTEHKRNIDTTPTIRRLGARFASTSVTNPPNFERCVLRMSPVRGLAPRVQQPKVSETTAVEVACEIRNESRV